MKRANSSIELGVKFPSVHIHIIIINSILVAERDQSKSEVAGMDRVKYDAHPVGSTK